MAKINPNIFKAYDVRGIYTEEINEEAVYLIAKALVKFLNAKSIVLARDMRVSSEKLYQAVLRGLQEAGIKIFDVGLATTPMHTFVMNYEEAGGGIMITASHNPGDYNGMKLEGKRGISIGQGSGMEEIKEIVINGKLSHEQNLSPKAQIISKDYLAQYVNFLADKFRGEDFSRLKIAIDASNGMTGMILPQILKKLNINYIPLYFELDGNFPHHEANPAKPENLKDLSELVARGNLNLGVAFDGDGDRVGFVGANGEPISIDFIFSALAKFFLVGRPREKIIYSSPSSHVVSETIAESGGRPLLCRVGHSFFRRMMHEEKAFLGCEVSGHCFFEEFFDADSAILTMLYVLKMISRSGQNIESLTSPFKKYFQSGEINFEIANKAGAIAALGSVYADGNVSHFDGLTAEYDDWWFNIRPSNTEPVIRLNIEANTLKLLEEKKKEILEKIFSLNETH